MRADSHILTFMSSWPGSNGTGNGTIGKENGGELADKPMQQNTITSSSMWHETTRDNSRQHHQNAIPSNSIVWRHNIEATTSRSNDNMMTLATTTAREAQPSNVNNIVAPSPAAAFQNKNNPPTTENSTPLQPAAAEPSTADLRSYLTSPASERNARLEHWICEQLEDETFLELSQQMEGVWRRMALGR